MTMAVSRSSAELDGTSVSMGTPVRRAGRKIHQHEGVSARGNSPTTNEQDVDTDKM